MTFFHTSATKLLTAGTALVMSPVAVLAQEVAADGAASGPPMPSLWDMAIQGGWFMIPTCRSSRSIATWNC